LHLFNADISDEKVAKFNAGRAKAAATHLRNYGVATGFERHDVRARGVETLKARYGVDNPNKVPGAAGKATATLVARTGSRERNTTRQHRHSKAATEWLDGLGIARREVCISIDGKRLYVDGMSDDGSTVYEFYGNYWHGNPRMYRPDFFNPQAKKTMGELYVRTLERERLLRSRGYCVHTKWEDGHSNHPPC
jgi:hypothetical protein